MRATLVLLIAFLVLSLPIVAVAQDEERGRPAAEPTPEPAPALQPGVTPTADRLAAPPTVPAPTQADDGAQLYWLHCQPCHGDRGQGLTEEWRMQYPEEDRNCWNSGCHGDMPYDSGFTIPTAVPAVVGETIHQKFPSDGALYQYIRASMPYWNPASLTDEEYLAITAHLARQNGRWDGRPLTVDGLATQQADALAAASPAATPVVATETPVVATETPVVATAEAETGNGRMLAGLAAVVVVVAGGFFLWQRANRTN